METFAAFGLNSGDVYFLALTALVSAGSSLAVFSVCVYWFRREQKRLQKRFVGAMSSGGRRPEDMILMGSDAMICGELVARVNHGRLVVSVLEADGRRYIHVNGELSATERSKVVHYLKSEGFMS